TAALVDGVFEGAEEEHTRHLRSLLCRGKGILPISPHNDPQRTTRLPNDAIGPRERHGFVTPPSRADGGCTNEERAPTGAFSSVRGTVQGRLEATPACGDDRTARSQQWRRSRRCLR